MPSAAELAQALHAKRTGRDWLARCPAHGDRTPSLAIAERDGRILVHCHAGCPQDEVLAALAERGLWEAPPTSPSPPPRAPDKKRPLPRSAPDLALALWDEAADPRGTLAERYLTGRGLALPENPARVLRFHPHCPFGRHGASVRRVPALVALFRDILTNRPAAIHRIGLDPDGAKLGKMMLGPTQGAAVKLTPDHDVANGLGVTEGIETGLRLLAEGWSPIWALGSAGAMGALPLLAGVTHLTLFADNDHNGVGQAAANLARWRWVDAGLAATILTPRAQGTDWADRTEGNAP